MIIVLSGRDMFLVNVRNVEPKHAVHVVQSSHTILDAELITKKIVQIVSRKRIIKDELPGKNNNLSRCYMAIHRNYDGWKRNTGKSKPL